MVDTTAIHRAIAVARRRLKFQAALESFTFVSVAASAIALVSVLLARLGVVSEQRAILLLIGCASLLAIGAIVGFARPFTKNRIATMLDRQAGLADRLATACAFEQTLGAPKTEQALDDETESMMRLAIADAVGRVAKADPRAATPFRMPRHTRAALIFAVLALVAAGIRVQTQPELTALSPDVAHRGDAIVASGHRMLSPAGALETKVILGQGATAMTIATLQEVHGEGLMFIVPAEAPLGPTTIVVQVGSRTSEALPFVVLADDDVAPGTEPETENLALEDEDIDYLKDLIAELRDTAEANEDLALEELANELEKVVKDVEDGKVTKKELLEALAKAEEKYMEGSEEAVEETVSDLKEAGKELKKDKLTKELGKALEAGDLDKAKQEMEKLAQKLDDNKMSEKEQEKLGKAMERAAEKMDKEEKKREQSMDKRAAKQQESIRKLEKKQQEEKDENKRKETARRLEKEKRELKRLQREREERKKDPAKRELKELKRKMSDAAKELQKKNQDQKKQQKSRREVSKSMREMAKSTQKVSQDKRKMANKQKVTSQMSDLKEAMRRAKRKGKQGAKNQFGRNKRKRDFGSRARGGKGQKGAWKPGQGQGQGQKGQGKGQKGQGKGQGNKPGGDSYGDSHDPNVMGDPTKMAGNAVDESLQGVRGKGPSTRETILTAAQKGFASRSYEDVYTKYKTIVEESIKAETVPSGYKYYVKRYFQKIKPKTDSN